MNRARAEYPEHTQDTGSNTDDQHWDQGIAHAAQRTRIYVDADVAEPERYQEAKDVHALSHNIHIVRKETDQNRSRRKHKQTECRRDDRRHEKSHVGSLL